MWKIHNKLLIFLLWIMEIRLISSFSSSILCARIPGLTQQQRQLCSEAPDAFIALGEGHQMGAHECQYQFRGHRWNCSDAWRSEVFGQFMLIGSREAAYTYAIASAGAAHAVTAACGSGNITNCGCDMRHKPQAHHTSTIDGFPDSGGGDDRPWQWGGCSADIDYGMKYSRKFLDARELEGDARSLMNLHNNRAGRRIVKHMLRTECKCHGVSGSCAMKTCWKSLPSFRVVGDVLMKKYHRAKSVHAIRDKHGLKLVLSKKYRPGKSLTPVPKRMELVYLKRSPDYCERNLLLNTPGTAGRHCNHTLPNGPDSCELLCCGRGYTTRHIHRKYQCHCEFRWCCEVECKICEQNEEEHTCK